MHQLLTRAMHNSFHANKLFERSNSRDSISFRPIRLYPRILNWKNFRKEIGGTQHDGIIHTEEASIIEAKNTRLLVYSINLTINNDGVWGGVGYLVAAYRIPQMRRNAFKMY